MKSNTQTKELLIAIAGFSRSYMEANADGKVSLVEWSRIVMSNAADIVVGAMGAGEILAEAFDFTAPELDDLYFSFLTRLDWQPTDDTRDRFFVFFKIVRDTLINLVLLHNTLNPPKAVIA